MICDFEKVGDELYQCKVCGLKIHSKDPSKIYATCHGEPRRKPSIFQQATNYAKAVARHISNGMETRSDVEVSDILSTCRKCEDYLPEESRCRVCGCRLSNGESAFTNKLRMASEKCPKGRWGFDSQRE